ncbi:NAD-dependent epimerase/dehydratase family protein [Catenulispora subtropica]|uniref:NAD-dependent epimerase/dehydratase family protein n=1 Tax=Catenulispora subtropica TaxID=450798 RepID=A0ABN2S964_9ACTN
MRVLLIGASGYVGSAVAERLTAEGHEVVALARPGSTRPAVPFERRFGDLKVPASLTAAVTDDIDGVVHLATPTGDARMDAAAVTALTEPMHGTIRPFVYTSGVWVLGATGEQSADEKSPTDPIAIVGYRPSVEEQVLALTDNGIRATVLRPGIVHGRGGGIPALLVDWARKTGVPRVVGAMDVRWPMVHVDDLADLYVKVLTQAPARTVWHGVAEPAVPVRELAAAAGRAAGVTGDVQVWPVDEAGQDLGKQFAEALALDQSVTAENAHTRLEWKPRGLDAVSDLRVGSYRV